MTIFRAPYAKKFADILMKLKESKPYPYLVGNFGPPPASFRVKMTKVQRLKRKLSIKTSLYNSHYQSSRF